MIIRYLDPQGSGLAVSGFGVQGLRLKTYRELS